MVRARDLWPRRYRAASVDPADKVVLSSIALEGKRRLEQYVATGFDEHHGDIGPADEDAGQEGTFHVARA